MSSGKGLESLIPPNQNNNSDQPSPTDTHQSSDSHNAVSDFEREPETQNPKPQTQQKDRVKKEEQHTPQQSKQSKPKQDKEADEAVFQIETDKIKPNPYQPRKEYDQDNLQELANSIREVGIIQPLVVSKVEEDTENGTKVEYQLISGERRLRASKLVGLERVPAIVRNVNFNTDKLSVALIENIQRDDLNPIEKARGYARLQDEFNLTQREVATKVGKARSSVANTLRLLNLPSEMQDAVSRGEVNESQARLLLSMENPEDQNKAFQQLLDNRINTKQLRRKVKSKKESNKNSTSNNNKSRQEQFWEKQLEEKFSTPVEISKQGDGGKLTIKFFSQDEWKGILDKLLRE